MEILFLIGRIIVGSYFIYNGFNHLTHISPLAQYASSKGVPIPKFMVVLTGLQILIGGLSILLGIYLQIGAWLLIIFLVVVAVIMHNFWVEEDSQTRQLQMVNFTKNIALAGSLLMISTIQSWPLGIL